MSPFVHPTRRGWRLRSLLCTTILFAGACGGGGGGDNTTTAPVTPVTPVTPPPGASNVTVGVSTFDPGTLTVAAGTTVTWTWSSCSSPDPYGYGGTCVTHGVAWDTSGGTDSPTQSSGTYQRQFTASGTYAYHCPIHGAAMSGVITVQ